MSAGAAPRSEDASPLAAPVTGLQGVGPRMAEQLARLGIETVGDLLLHLPARYQDRSHCRPIGGLTPGEEALVEGEVHSVQPAPGRAGRPGLVAWLGDDSGEIVLRFFTVRGPHRRLLEPGRRLRCYAEVRAGRQGPEMVHPELTALGAEPPPPGDTLTPIYPTTEGLHQQALRRATGRALAMLDGADAAGEPLAPHLPPALAAEGHLATFAGALRYLHRPPAGGAPPRLEAARARLAFDELAAQRIALRRLRRAVRAHPAPPLPADGALMARLEERLPFTLTGAQRRALAEIRADLAAERPMLRLLQGDVGSGKTVVAALAAAQAVAAGHQAAVMAPTELLAEQHLKSFRGWFEPLDVPVVCLSARLTRREREAALAALAAPRPLVAVGTHALFQDDVRFARLALAVIDEQHRFGVEQRLALAGKRGRAEQVAHQLVMTATPIPRTLAMTAFAELDVSLIDERPPGRTPVTTVAVPAQRRDEVIERIAAACRDGRQAYWVCPLIEESEALDCQAATDTAALLQTELADLRIGLVHGRLPERERDDVMQRFAAGELDLLVATTVIEVGVDVPNATIMVIDNAERLGLAQLHQLRGRVGRGSASSDCVLLYRPPLSAMARERIAVLRATDNGFEIAQRDLELRGPGELLGTRQAGLESYRVAELGRDATLVAPAARAADALAAADPDAAERLVARWARGGRAEVGL